jgi:hypothetical protein
MTLTSCQHDRTTPARDQASTTSLDLNHTQHMITLGITSKEHHGRSNHASITSTGTTSLAQPALENHDRLLTIKNGSANHAAPAAQRFGIQLPRARRTGRLQKPNDLAREAVSCNAGLGRARLIY